MLTLHDDIAMTCGDEWQILGQLLQEDGTPLDIADTVGITWTLIDPDGEHVPGLVASGTLERLTPTTDGKILITLDEELTRTFRPGRYTDAVRVTISDAPATLWRGMILAAADPFYAETIP